MRGSGGIGFGSGGWSLIRAPVMFSTCAFDIVVGTFVRLFILIMLFSLHVGLPTGAGRGEERREGGRLRGMGPLTCLVCSVVVLGVWFGRSVVRLVGSSVVASRASESGSSLAHVSGSSLKHS